MGSAGLDAFFFFFNLMCQGQGHFTKRTPTDLSGKGGKH